jgi:AraC-like DNA-binding protein
LILAFHPTHPDIPGEEHTAPGDWLRFVSPWSKSRFRRHDFGSTLIQELITPAFKIFIWRLDIEQTVRLYPSAEKPTIALQFTLEGNIPCKLTGFGDKLLEKGNFEMFYVPTGYNEAWFEPGQYESLHIELKPHYLEELTAVRPEIKALVSRLQAASSKGLPLAVARMNYITAAIIQNLKSCNRKAAALQLEMHKYILELLCEYLSAILQKEEDEKRINIPRKDLMIRIRDHILSSPNVHDHTLEKLARHFRINETMLKREFKALYEISVSEYVRVQVLERAHYLLTTTNRTVEDIAEEVGYAWRPAFDEAFKKQYDYSPSSLRSGLNS